MNYSIQKLVDDFIQKLGSDDLKMLQTVPKDAAFNYVYFLYRKFYEAYPTGEVYDTLANIFLREKAA